MITPNPAGRLFHPTSISPETFFLRQNNFPPFYLFVYCLLICLWWAGFLENSTAQKYLSPYLFPRSYFVFLFNQLFVYLFICSQRGHTGARAKTFSCHAVVLHLPISLSFPLEFLILVLFMYFCLCVCVSLRERERERERERDRMCVYVCVCVWEGLEPHCRVISFPLPISVETLLHLNSFPIVHWERVLRRTRECCV